MPWSMSPRMGFENVIPFFSNSVPILAVTWPLRPASGKKLDPRFAVNVERKHEATANNPIHLIITIVLVLEKKN